MSSTAAKLVYRELRPSAATVDYHEPCPTNASPAATVDYR